MPVGLAFAIGGIATGAGSMYAAHKSSEAANYAADLQTSAADKQLAFEQQQAALDQQRWQQTQQFNLDQYNAKEARLAPFRNLGTNANSTLSRLIGGDVVAPINYVPPPAKLPTDPSATPTPTTSPTTSSPPPNTASLSDPAAWMSLVGNDSQLTSFVQQGLGPKSGDPELVNYYVGKIKEQPGANPTEQAGSAQYWLDKMAKDPKVTGIAPTSVIAPFTSAGNGTPTLPTLPKDFSAQPAGPTAAAAPTSSLQRFIRTPALA